MTRRVPTRSKLPRHTSVARPVQLSADEYAVSNQLTLPAHGFGVPDWYSERVYDDFHDEEYDIA